MSEITELVRETARRFCLGYVRDPYLCYTEHGLHALFYTMLYNALPDEHRFTTWDGKKVCVVQKEYPTADNLGKSRRQNWDVSVIETPPISLFSGRASFDYLKLAAVVEFGLNATEEHLAGDIERLCHPEANVERRFVIHLYRLSTPGAKFSNRDSSPDERGILSAERVAEIASNKPLEIYYGMCDSTSRYPSGVWRIDRRGTELLT